MIVIIVNIIITATTITMLFYFISIMKTIMKLNFIPCFKNFHYLIMEVILNQTVAFWAILK